MSNLSKAKELLLRGGHTCVLCLGEAVHTSAERGVKPLLDWLDSGLDLRDFSAADKVVGRATAFLYRLLGVRRVHALVMSTPAKEALTSGGIAATCDTEVAGIINRRGDGPCPFETAVLGITDAEEALTAIRKQQLRMRIPDSMKSMLDGREFRLDRRGLSGATIAIFQDMVLKCEQQSDNSETELVMLRWLTGKAPVPQVLATEVVHGYRCTLMTRLRGDMACDLRGDPWQVTRLLAGGLKLLWSIDCRDCPVDQSLAAKLARLEEGHLTMDESVSREVFPTPAHLLRWLREQRPAEDRVLTHGDYCMPNLFFEEGQLSGFLDLGRSGVGDPWVDIAICWRSLRDNFGGHYGAAVPGFHADYLFEVLGIPKDPEKLQYYLNLDELF